MRYLTLLAPLALSAFSAAAGAADCQPALLGGNVSVIVDGVEIVSGGRTTENFQIRVQNQADTGTPGAGGAGQCGATIRLARIEPGVDPDFPPYSLSAPGNRNIEVLPDLTSGGSVDSDVIIANAPSGPQGRVVPFQLNLATEWGLRAGTYTQHLRISLVDESGNVTDTGTLTITIIIPPTVSIRFVGAVVGGTAGAARIDLGNLSSTRETRSDPFGALILSTSPYLVSFSSLNLGHLAQDRSGEKIPYRLYFEGTEVDLAGVSEFPYFSRTPPSGDRRPMSIVVAPTQAPAGRYEDRITATVTAM